MCTIEIFDIALVKNSLHGFQSFQLRTQGIQRMLLQHFSPACRYINIVFVNIPATKDNVFQLSQWNEFLDLWIIVTFLTIQMNVPHLRNRPNGLSNSFLYGLYACNQCSSYRA